MYSACAPYRPPRQARSHNAENKENPLFLHCFPANTLPERFDFFILCDYTYRYFRSDPESSNATKKHPPKRAAHFAASAAAEAARRPSGDHKREPPDTAASSAQASLVCEHGWNRGSDTIVPKFYKLRGVFILFWQCISHAFPKQEVSNMNCTGKQEENPHDHHFPGREQTRICGQHDGA